MLLRIRLQQCGLVDMCILTEIQNIDLRCRVNGCRQNKDIPGWHFEIETEDNYSQCTKSLSLKLTIKYIQSVFSHRLIHNCQLKQLQIC